MVTVPKVVGQASLTTAKRILTTDGLSVGTIRRLTASAPPFGVVVQSPAAGSRVPVGTSVSLTDVSEAGIPLSLVPDVRGLGDPAATTRLQQAGFHVIVRVNSTGGIKPGDVMRQTPSPSTAIAANGTVTIWISPGIAIPDVVGMTVTAASRALQEAGFSFLVAGTPSGGKATGTVLSQSPRGGAWGDVEETVTLTVAK